MREEEGTVNFIFNSHKKLLLLELDTITFIFLFFLSKQKLYQLDITAAPWKGCDLPALHPVIPKTLVPSHLLFSLVDFCLVGLSTQR